MTGAAQDQQGNLAAVLLEQDNLQVQTVPMPPEPHHNQVLIEIKNVGICGSDVHYWKHGRIGDFVVKQAMIIGHESAGIVKKVGASVHNVALGDRVALEPGLPCRRCRECRTGAYNLCAHVKFFATPPVHGCLAKYVVHDADFCYKLPDNVSLEEGALCEPLSVGVYACDTAGVRVADSVAVFGCGPIGLVSLLAAKAFGASKVFMTDVCPQRVAFAKKMGADHVINVKEMDHHAVAETIQQLNNGHVDVSIDCCGFESATSSAILCTKSGGTVCLVGMGQPTMNLPILNAALREVNIKGIFRYRHTYPKCISLLNSGAVDVKPLITHRYKLDNLIEAFETARTGRDGAVKVMFEV